MSCQLNDEDVADIISELYRNYNLSVQEKDEFVEIIENDIELLECAWSCVNFCLPGSYYYEFLSEVGERDLPEGWTLRDIYNVVYHIRENMMMRDHL
jgi:hypothetical protein